MRLMPRMATILARWRHQPEPVHQQSQGRRYGGRAEKRNTIHATEHLDVETDETGAVISVWFRCQMLPFEQTRVDASRAEEMRRAYRGHSDEPTRLIAVEVEP